MKDEKLLEEFRAKFRVDELSLVKYKSWELSLRPQQLTLGSMVLSSALNYFFFSDIDSSAQPELTKGFVAAEKIAINVFGADRINILCLMMQDPIVHFHIIPRYSVERSCFGAIWLDEDWPSPPVIRPVPVNEEVLVQLKTVIKEKSRVYSE